MNVLCMVSEEIRRAMVGQRVGMAKDLVLKLVMS